MTNRKQNFNQPNVVRNEADGLTTSQHNQQKDNIGIDSSNFSHYIIFLQFIGWSNTYPLTLHSNLFTLYFLWSFYILNETERDMTRQGKSGYSFTWWFPLFANFCPYKRVWVHFCCYNVCYNNRSQPFVFACGILEAVFFLYHIWSLRFLVIFEFSNRVSRQLVGTHHQTFVLRLLLLTRTF